MWVYVSGIIYACLSTALGESFNKHFVYFILYFYSRPHNHCGEWIHFVKICFATFQGVEDVVVDVPNAYGIEDADKLFVYLPDNVFQ